MIFKLPHSANLLHKHVGDRKNFCSTSESICFERLRSG